MTDAQRQEAARVIYFDTYKQGWRDNAPGTGSTIYTIWMQSKARAIVTGEAFRGECRYRFATCLNCELSGRCERYAKHTAEKGTNDAENDG